MQALRILVADSSPEWRGVVEETLRSRGYDVECVESPDVAVERLAGDGYDMVVLDRELAPGGGFDPLIRIHEAAPDTSVIVVDSSPTVDDAVEAMRRGAFHYMGKAEDLESLLRTVDRGLEEKRVLLEVAARGREQRIRSFETLDSFDRIEMIIRRHNAQKSMIIPILQDIQRELRYLPRDSLRFVANRLEIPLSQVYSVATFYKAFSLKPRGRHIIQVCLGTACHVRGGVGILERLERELGIRDAETTYDERFSLSSVRCVGCCGLAPVIVVNEDFHGNLTQDRIPRILKQYP